jgi:hypothetical protein
VRDISTAVVASGKGAMSMATLNEVTKRRVTEGLDSTSYTQQDFTVKYGDENNPLAIITFSSFPECQFVINSTHHDAFTTSECPGVKTDGAEIFQRDNFELCINAIEEWVQRIIDRQNDWILDEFGGVADSNPSYTQRGKNH